MITRIFSCLLLVSVPLWASAAGDAQERRLISAEPESQTAYWLRAQREGTYASPHAQTQSPAERELALQRLLESYKHPIPEFFEQEAGGELAQ